MTLNELIDYLEPRFDIEIIKGYNSSLHTSLDADIRDTEFAKRWAAAHEGLPQDACGFVIMAHKIFGWQPKKYTRSTFFSTNSELIREGGWNDVPLHQSLQGLQGKAGSRLSLDFKGVEIVVLLWMHDWSGLVEVVVDHTAQKIDLFSNTGGFRRVIFKGLQGDVSHKLTINPTGEKNTRSCDDQVIFFSASVYDYIGQ